MNFPLIQKIADVRRALAELRAERLVEYPVIWTGETTNPVIGNGTLVGMYWREQYTCCVQVQLNIGSTTTLGTGQWHFSLPMLPRAEMSWTGGAGFYDSGSRVYAGQSRVSADFVRLFSETPGGASGFVQSNTPFGWGTGDIAWFNIAYPV